MFEKIRSRAKETRERFRRELRRRIPEALLERLDRLVERRRGLLRIAGALLVLTLLVIAPGYLALQPHFVERYANMDAAYTSWAGSTHAEIHCRSCHVSPRITAQSAFALRMLGEFYVSMVAPGRQPSLFARPQNAACTSCHLDTRTASPTGDLKIPHQAHVRVLKLRCVHCHSYVVHEANPEGRHTPRMTTCMKCHDGRQARKDCPACHVKKDLPKNHRTPDWLVVHPDKQRDIDCKECHAWTPRWCRQCHSLRPASHKGRWRSMHRFNVQRHRNCEACHKGPFCIRCHGEVPQLDFDPALKYVE